MVVGDRRSSRPVDDDHPQGYRREAFFWAVLSALAMLFIGAGLSAWRGIEQLTDPKFSDLPAFLVEEPGLNSGFMIAHVTAAALASENKTLCFPASVDSITTSAGQEDHVSMGMGAALKMDQVLDNTRRILAVELCALRP